jgi:hypothetical protein
MKETGQSYGAASRFSITLAVEKESVDRDQLTEATDAEKSALSGDLPNICGFAAIL